MMAPLRPVGTTSPWLLAAALALLGARGGETQNLIVANPEFDDDVAGWDLVGGGSWDGGDDLDGCTAGTGSSGSLDATALPAQFPGDYAFSGGGPSLCIAVTPGETIYTEVAYRSPAVADIFPFFFAEPDCAGSAPVSLADGSFPASAQWNVAAESFTVPPGTASIRLYWYAAEVDASTLDTSWDRAYIGRRARIFSDDFEAGFHCRWSTSAGGPPPDTTPPSNPSPVTSPSHGDGLPHPNPIEIAWGVSVDTGSGLAGYRVGLADLASPPECDLLPSFVTGNSGEFQSVPSGTWYAYVCAEDHAGNQSAVIVGGPYLVN